MGSLLTSPLWKLGPCLLLAATRGISPPEIGPPSLKIALRMLREVGSDSTDMRTCCCCWEGGWLPDLSTYSCSSWRYCWEAMCCCCSNSCRCFSCSASSCFISSAISCISSSVFSLRSPPLDFLESKLLEWRLIGGGVVPARNS